MRTGTSHPVLHSRVSAVAVWNPSLAGWGIPLQRSSDGEDYTVPGSSLPSAPMPPAPATPLLLGCPGCGSAIVECAFALAGLPLEVEDVDYSAGSPTRARLLAVNPLGQVPALVFPDGRVLTESLAILHGVNELAPDAGLVPGPGEAAREAFHRWVVFLVASVYPTFTYGDEPGKWVADERGAGQLRLSTDRHRERLWREMDAHAMAPWFLGERLSAIDLYLLVMTRWRPGPAWFRTNAARLDAIATRAGTLAPLGPILKRHFGA